jgi:YD repeat-containing protein
MFTNKIYLILLISLLTAYCASPPETADAASYAYDTLSRITRADYDSGFTEKYAYDAAGNRLTVEVTSKRISGYGHATPATGTSAEISVGIRAWSPETGFLTYNNTDAGIKLSSVSVSSLIIESNTAIITGECTLNGLSGYYYTAILSDNPDSVKIEIYTPDNTLYFFTETNGLTDGGLVIEAEPFRRHQLTASSSPVGGGKLSPDCSSGCTYENGTTVTITANCNSNYSFIEWRGCDSASNNICIIMMDSGRAVDAFFTPCDSPVRLAGSGYFPNPQDAYDSALDGNTIELQETSFTGEIYFDRDISVSLLGGHDCTYSNNNGSTTLEGQVIISSGTVTIGDIVIK